MMQLHVEQKKLGLPSNPGSHLRDEFREGRKLLLDEIACDVVPDLAGCLVELGSAIADENLGLVEREGIEEHHSPTQIVLNAPSTKGPG